MGERGCFLNTILFLIIVFIPVLGHIIETVMIAEDDHSLGGKVIWLLLIWLIPFVGPLLYLLFGQRPRRRPPVMFGQASHTGQLQYQSR
jgi:hypothetical protein